MARSPIFRTLSRLLQYSIYAERKNFSRNQRVEYFLEQKEKRSLLSRREFLLGSAAALAAPSTLLGREQISDSRPSVVIVGAGLAGLATAYWLYQRHGIVSVIYEGSNRLGGRIFTRGGSSTGQFNQSKNYVELGGQFVDTSHKAVFALCQQLGMPKLLCKAEEPDYEDIEQEIFWYDKTYQSTEKILHAFEPMAEALLEKQKQVCPGAAFITPSYNSVKTPAMESLDDLSLAEFLSQLEGRVDKGMLNLILQSYEGELGAPAADQSAIGLFDCLDVTKMDSFEIFGGSDELYQIPEGSESLIRALEANLSETVPIFREHRLVEMRD